MYKTEAHIHTMEVSRCGKVAAAEIVKLYAEAGFDTVFIADHINGQNFALWTDLSWEEKVDRHMEGYKAAKLAGEELGVTVLYCAEIAFGAPGGFVNDYLVYGFDRDFLIGFEPYFRTSVEKFYPYAKEHGVLVIQAHPYRTTACCPMPDYVDGIEVYNAHPRHINNNQRAQRLAEERGLLKTVGSDFHMVGDEARAYILTEEPIRSVEDYISVIKSGKAILMSPEGEIK